MTMRYLIEECDCQRSQIAITDEDGEDINLMEAYREALASNEKCGNCSKLHKYSTSE